MKGHHFLIVFSWDALSVNANRMKKVWNNTKRCLSHVFQLEQLKIYEGGTNRAQKQWRGPTTWEDILKMCWKTLRIGTHEDNNFLKKSSHCLDDDHVKKEKLELSKLCSQILLKCLYLARIGRPDILR